MQFKKRTVGLLALAVFLAGSLIASVSVMVVQTVDWGGCVVTYVEFSSGYHAEHHDTNSSCAPDLIVRYYSPEGVKVWP